MGRTISSLVKVGWTAAQVEERAQKMVKHILEGLNN
jgi:hypothetical protein